MDLQIVFFEVCFGRRAEPVATSVGIVNEHAVVRLSKSNKQNRENFQFIICLPSNIAYHSNTELEV